MPAQLPGSAAARRRRGYGGWSGLRGPAVLIEGQLPGGASRFSRPWFFQRSRGGLVTIPPKGAIRSSILLVAALSGPIVIGTPSPAPASTSTTIVATDVAAQAGIAQTTPTWSA